jgi:hypothetical protein
MTHSVYCTVMKTKIIHIIVPLIICLQCSSVIANVFLGKYVTKPNVFPGFSEPYSDQVSKAIQYMTWELEITEKEIIWWIDKESDPEIMPYTQNGNFLLAKEKTSKIIKYIPFYVEDGEKIHGLSTVFFKKN